MSTVKITTTNFEQEVLQSQIPVLLDFWADWCGRYRIASIPTFLVFKNGELTEKAIGLQSKEDLMNLLK